MKFKGINFATLKKLLPFLFIVLMAIVVVWLANKYLTGRTAEVEERLADQAAKTRIKVVVATRDLMAGEELSLATLATREVPKEYVNYDALTQDTVAAYEGKKLLKNVKRGTPFLASFITSYEFKPFSTTLEAGTRAITLPVDEINSVSGMVVAGDKVDILVLTQGTPPPGATPRAEMQLVPLLEGVTIRATGTTTQRELNAQLETADVKGGKPTGTYTTITIAVTPRDAQRVVLAQQAGRIIALLRRADDAALYNGRLSSSDVFGYDVPRTPPKVNEPKTIAYIIGGNFSSGSQGLRAPTGAGAAPNMEALKRLLQGGGASDK